MTTISPKFYANDARAKHRQKIDEEIAELEGRILFLRSTRNTLSPVASLHAEILQEIFSLTSAESKSRGKTVLLLTWVCHTWRDIAHQTSALWTFIDHQPCLVVAPPGSQKDAYHLGSVALSNLPRVSRFSMESDPAAKDDHFPRLPPLCLNPAPLLVELNLHHVWLYWNCLVGTCPMLETLVLESCTFNWNWIPIQAGIRKLVITRPTCGTSVTDLLDRLKPLAPTAETITLRNTILLPTGFLPNHPVPTRREFVKLKSFEMKGDMGCYLAVILDHCIFPPRCDISTSVEGPLENQSAARALTLCRGDHTWRIDSVQLDLEDKYLNIIMEERWKDSRDEGEGGHDGVDVDEGEDNHITLISLKVPHFNALPNTIPLIDILPLQSIKTLVLSGGRPGRDDFQFFDYVNTLGTVKFIDVLDFYVINFVDAIRRQNIQLSGLFIPPVSSITTLSSAEKVQCRNIIMFHQLKELRCFGDPTVDNTFNEQDLREWLAWRKLVGLKIELLTLSDLVVVDQGNFVGRFDGLADEIECIRVRDVAEVD